MRVRHVTGARNDGFLLSTLETLNSIGYPELLLDRSLELHS